MNAGKEWGFGFKFDYLYGRGYYSNQSASHFNYSMWGSYLGERYQAHLLLSLNHQKVAENGGIANDAYITHPESFRDSYSEEEIPTILKQNWNRNDNQHVFFNHRYSLGFFRKVPMTEEEIKAKQFALNLRKHKKHSRIKRRLVAVQRQRARSLMRRLTIRRSVLQVDQMMLSSLEMCHKLRQQRTIPMAMSV